MGTLYLHVGIHKTGSTAIQNQLFANRARLKESGTEYLDVCANHSEVIYSLFSLEPHNFHVNLSKGLDTPEKVAEHNKALWHDLRRRLADVQDMIISGEDICLLHDNGLKRLKSFFEVHFDQIRIIAYVREPYRFISSLAQEGLKFGWTLQDLYENPPIPDYRSRLQKFYDNFEHVDVRLFRRDMDRDWDVVGDFLQAAGIHLELRSEASHNESLSINAARLLDSANRRFPYRNENGLNPQRARNFAASALMIRGPKFRLPQDVMDSIRDRIESECEWTREKTGLDLLQLGTSDKGEEIGVTYDSIWDDMADVINDLSLKWERTVNTSQYYERILGLRED